MRVTRLQSSELQLTCPEHHEIIIYGQIFEYGLSKMCCSHCLGYFKQDESIGIKTIEQYSQSSDQSTQFQQIQKQNEVSQALLIESKDVFRQKKTPMISNRLGYYKLSFEMKKIAGCQAMDMDKDEKILINGQYQNIQLWNYNVKGSLTLQQTLKGHTGCVYCLSFSKKDNNWFISGSDDQTIIIWKKEQDNKWMKSQRIKGHQNCVWNVVLNTNEDQFVSCGGDSTINVWMTKVENKIWEIKQTLTEHTSEVYYLSLTENCDLLASSGDDKLRIWTKGMDQLWKQKQVLDHPINDKYNRISFDKSKILTATTENGKFITTHIKDPYIVDQEISLTENSDSSVCFPIIQCKQIRIVACRHDECVYLLTDQASSQFLIHQTLKGDYRAGYISIDGRHLILSNEQTKTIETWELN